MAITPQQEEEFLKTVDCHICNEILGADRVRDHCHLTGLFRRAANNECYLKYKFKKETKNNSFFIPVIFHNLRGYDSHLIMSAIGKYKKRRLNCIPNNMEKYINFSLGNLRFIDSCQFLNASLEGLGNNLAADGKAKFAHLCSEVLHHQDLLIRKGVYRYDYVDGPAKLLETRLPFKTFFYSILKE